MNGLEQRLSEVQAELAMLRVHLEEAGVLKDPSGIFLPDDKTLSDADDGFDSPFLALDHDDEEKEDRSCPFRVRSLVGYKNPNWRQRCACSRFGTCTTRGGGISYYKAWNFTTYDIEVILVHGQRINDWNYIINRPRIFRCLAPAGKKGGMYLTNFTDSASFTRFGTFGFRVYQAGTANLISDEWIWHGRTSTEGEEWWHCGKDFIMTLQTP